MRRRVAGAVARRRSTGVEVCVRVVVVVVVVEAAEEGLCEDKNGDGVGIVREGVCWGGWMRGVGVVMREGGKWNVLMGGCSWERLCIVVVVDEKGSSFFE